MAGRIDDSHKGNTMILRLTTLMMLAVLAAFPAMAQEPKIVFADNFSDVDGQQTTNMNGYYEDSGSEKTRNTFSYLSESIEGGNLTMTIFEDDETKGPDEKPGVLSLRYDDLPESASYSGFVYQGRAQANIMLPPFAGKISNDDLRKVTISFRYRATNPRKEHVGATYNCRFEADVDDAYQSRIDFGSIKATDQWQTFAKTLGTGSNRDKFIEVVNESPNPALKIVWGQEGEISNYENGDTLLIDDIKITIVK